MDVIGQVAPERRVGLGLAFPLALAGVALGWAMLLLALAPTGLAALPFLHPFYALLMIVPGLVAGLLAVPVIALWKPRRRIAAVLVAAAMTVALVSAFPIYRILL